eukprot:6189007-Pleurochrysis_carterae.AAC.1
MQVAELLEPNTYGGQSCQPFLLLFPSVFYCFSFRLLLALAPQAISKDELSLVTIPLKVLAKSVKDPWKCCGGT